MPSVRPRISVTQVDDLSHPRVQRLVVLGEPAGHGDDVGHRELDRRVGVRRVEGRDPQPGGGRQVDLVGSMQKGADQVRPGLEHPRGHLGLGADAEQVERGAEAAISSSSSRAPARVSTPMPASPLSVDASGCRFSSSRGFHEARARSWLPGRIGSRPTSPRPSPRASRLAPTIWGSPRISAGAARASTSSRAGPRRPSAAAARAALADDRRRSMQDRPAGVPALPDRPSAGRVGRQRGHRDAARPGARRGASKASSRSASLVSAWKPAVGGACGTPRSATARTGPSGAPGGRHRDHRHGGPGQRERAEHVGGQLLLEPVDRAGVRRGHHSGVVDQQVHSPYAAARSAARH